MKKKGNKSYKDIPEYFCDFETTRDCNSINCNQNEEGGQVFLSNIHYLDNDNEVHIIGKSIEEWFEQVKELLKTKRHIILYFHNIKFDGNFILKHLINKQGFKNVLTINRRDKTFIIHYQGGTWYSIEICLYLNKEYRTIIIKDSLKILSSSVNSLSKSYENKDKYLNESEKDTLYNICNHTADDIKYSSRMIDYIKNDTWVVRESIKDLTNTINDLPLIIDKRQTFRNALNKDWDNQLVKKKTTIASISYDLASDQVYKYLKDKHYWTHKRIKEEQFKYIKTSRVDWEYTHQYMFGGLTQYSLKAKQVVCNPKTSIGIDVHSAYPYWMTKPLPYGDFIDEEPADFSRKKYAVYLEINIKKAKSKYDYVPFLKETENKLCRYTYEVNEPTMYYFFIEEWAALQNYYEFEYEIINIRFKKKKPYLKELIDSLYLKKKEYSKNKKDKGRRLSIKILMNAGFGSFAKRLDYDQCYLIPKNDFEKYIKNTDTVIIDDKPMTFIRAYDSELFDGYLNVIYKDPNEYESEYGRNIDVAAYVTAQQRSYLMNTIYKIGTQYFMYCDTDSIYFANLPEDKYEYVLKLCDNDDELGKWGIDVKNIRYFDCTKAKNYYIEYLDENGNIKIKTAQAGISEMIGEDIKEIRKQDEYVGKYMKPTITKTGITLQDSYKTIKTKGVQ